MKIERTLALIKTGAVWRGQAGDIVRGIIKPSGLLVCNRRFYWRGSRDKFATLYVEHEGRPYYDGLIASVVHGSIALELRGDNAVAAWRELMGPTDPVKARETAPDSIRARFGTELPDNAVHGSDSVESAAREIAIFFGQP